MNEKRRMACLLVVCVACALLLGCHSTPSVTPEVVDTVTQLTDATDTLGDAITDAAEDHGFRRRIQFLQPVAQGVQGHIDGAGDGAGAEFR